MKLSIEHISKSYKENKALTNFSAELSPGIYALLDPNGIGKSTLMNILTGNLTADTGSISFDGKDIRIMGERFRKKLGYMPQYPGMYPTFSVSRFLWYIATLKGLGVEFRGKERKNFIKTEIERVLCAVELSDMKHHKIMTLSGGMKQRLALAQASLGSPDILILDEPTAGLDPKQRILIRKFISEIALERIVILAAHVVSNIEYIAKEVIMMRKGEIIDQGTPQELTEKMNGRVWNLCCKESEIARYEKDLQIIGISKNEDDTVNLRVLSKSGKGMISLSPTLEDFYLSVFQKI